MIFCPNGPELEINNRHAVAKEQVSQNTETPPNKLPSSIRSRQHSGDRRERLGEFLFWEATISEDGGPDVDILARKSVVQSGVPAEAITEWADDTEYLSRVRETARAISQTFSSDQGWFDQFQRDMKAANPNWTWQGDVTVHRGPVPEPPPAPQQAGSSSANV